MMKVMTEMSCSDQYCLRYFESGRSFDYVLCGGGSGGGGGGFFLACENFGRMFDTYFHNNRIHINMCTVMTEEFVFFTFALNCFS